jgi:hypothetical protein
MSTEVRSGAGNASSSDKWRRVCIEGKEWGENEYINQIAGDEMHKGVK